MKGTHHVIVQNKRIKFEFDLRRNLTVLRGDSATGKTTLVEMIREFVTKGRESSVEVRCDKTCYVLEEYFWESTVGNIHDGIVFIDEGNPFVLSHLFAQTIQETDNYYVIVSRESLPSLPYSVEEVYGIHMSGRYGRLNQCWNEFYRIYHPELAPQSKPILPEVVITEDSNAGFEFFSSISEENSLLCISASGKSKILSAIKQHLNRNTLVVVDGAAFGPEMDRVMKLIENTANVYLYAPESFEWVILSSEIITDSEISKILQAPGDFIESKDYFSWERFFSSLLVERTQGTYLKYSKYRLNPAYLKGDVKTAILHSIQPITFRDNAGQEIK